MILLGSVDRLELLALCDWWLSPERRLLMQVRKVWDVSIISCHHITGWLQDKLYWFHFSVLVWDKQRFWHFEKTNPIYLYTQYNQNVISTLQITSCGYADVKVHLCGSKYFRHAQKNASKLGNHWDKYGVNCFSENWGKKKNRKVIKSSSLSPELGFTGLNAHFDRLNDWPAISVYVAGSFQSVFQVF